MTLRCCASGGKQHYRWHFYLCARTRRTVDTPARYERRAGAGANGIFSRRLDFSTFNLLPKHKVNSYQIKVDALKRFVRTKLETARTSPERVAGAQYAAGYLICTGLEPVVCQATVVTPCRCSAIAILVFDC
ncbi:Headcase protein [Eumeta japonica]|uniref:Headcase protein n=1 Tax=Eumeta variegata TaxID=151549 RepID=A0A4C1UN93_EUMVA|nr:Headcase protein [Eumeta japonica]